MLLDSTDAPELRDIARGAGLKREVSTSSPIVDSGQPESCDAI